MVLSSNQLLQLFAQFRLVDFLLSVCCWHCRCRRGTQPRALLLVQPPMQPLALAVAVLHLLALGAFLVGLLIAAGAAERVHVLKSPLAVDRLLDDLQRRQVVLLAGELSHHLLEDRALSERELAHALADRQLHVVALAVLVGLQHALDEQLEVVGLGVLVLLLRLLPREEVLLAGDDLVHHPAEEVVLERHQLVDLVGSLHLALRHQLEDPPDRLVVLGDDAELLQIEADAHRMDVGLDDEFVERVEKRGRQ